MGGRYAIIIIILISLHCQTCAGLMTCGCSSRSYRTRPVITYTQLGQASRPEPKPVESQPVITLPVVFHVLKGIVMRKSGVVMNVWVGCIDTPGLLFEINRIWSPANIQFEIPQCSDNEVILSEYQLQLVQAIETAEKDSDYRGRAINDLVDSIGVHRNDALNVYLIPFLGADSQGIAKIGGTKATIGVWSDKFSKDVPVRSLLVESNPMVRGSIARTIAHEFGHNLGLDHPTDGVVSFPRLMGGDFQGYGLTDSEVTQARSKAIEQSDAFKVRGWGS